MKNRLLIAGGLLAAVAGLTACDNAAYTAGPTTDSAAAPAESPTPSQLDQAAAWEAIIDPHMAALASAEMSADPHAIVAAAQDVKNALQATPAPGCLTQAIADFSASADMTSQAATLEIRDLVGNVDAASALLHQGSAKFDTAIGERDTACSA